MFVLRVWKSCKAIVFFCRNCERFLIPPSEWDQCSLEPKELLSQDAIPELLLFKNYYDKSQRRQCRNWKLKHITEEDALDTDIKEDCNEFLEEDPEMRQNVDIFKDAARQQSVPVDVNDMADPSMPRITLEELLDDLLLTVAQYGQALRDTVSVKQPHSKLSNLRREYIKQVHKKPVVVLREPVASFQCKEHEAAQDANADDGQRVGGIFGQCGLEDAQDGRDSDGGPAGELVANGGWRGRLEVFRDKAEEYGPFAAAGTSQRGRGNSAQRVQQERARSDSADCIPEQYISALLMEIPTLMQQKTVHHTSQLMALGSENLLANFRTCLGIIEYWVQHANSVSK
ncbi:hypothetical protein quinque_013828 [Culex quinquefasciatus]